ncbi:MAG: hypothetical protein ACI9VR_000867 [Cognaticolwellia sp.]|jgi:hypothetical protein
MAKSSEIAARFLAIDAFLHTHRSFWQPRPFHGDPLPWTKQAPELAHWLRSKPQQWVDDNEDTAPLLPDCPPTLSELHRRAQTLCALPRLQGVEHPLDLRLTRGIPGRKLGQIQAFAQVALPRLRTPILADWCAGKAHLSRSLAKLSGAQVHSYERDAGLCAKAESLAQAQCVDLQAHVVDVCTHTPLLPDTATLVGLHACGELTDIALATAHREGLSALMLAPCCHHKRKSRSYVARSALGQRASQLLQLEESALRLSTARVVIATRRMRRIRANKMLYRVAYRHVVPGTFRSGPESWFTGDFNAFCVHLSEREGHVLPPFQAEQVLTQARAEVLLARAMGMVRAPFRRPIELWLNLDRALVLEEQGWSVEIGRFCSESISPRDILIAATRGEQQPDPLRYP